MGSHHVPADSPQTPGGKQKPSEIRKWKSFFFVGLFRVYFSKKKSMDDKVRGRWKVDSLLSGEQVGVVHQFLGVLEATLKKGSAGGVCNTGGKQNT